MSSRPETRESIEDVAAGWVARQRSGVMTAQETRDLEAWLCADAAHREAFEHVEGLWRASARLRSDPQVMALRHEAARAYPATRKRRWSIPAAAAATLVAGVLGSWQAMSPQTAPTAPLAAAVWDEQVFSTGIGQRVTVTLSDGSAVTLDTDSRLRAREIGGKRRVWLDRGQAFFRVAHDPSRPFVVTAGGRTITALGTAFNVRLERDVVEVVLTEGRVKVEGPTPLLAPVTRKPPATELTPGSQLIAAKGDEWRVAKINVDEAISWRRGQLVFVRRPLVEVVEEMNRYSEKKIVVADEALAVAQITGGFAEGDVDGFVQALRGYGLAAVASESDKTVVLKVQ